MDSVLQDIRFAARSLWRARALSFTALLCLALGIGTNTGAFSIVHGILFRALPFADADRIVTVVAVQAGEGTETGITDADLTALRSNNAFADVQAFSGRNFTLSGGDVTERVQGSVVTPELFRMLGVQPQRGRHFLAEEAGPAGFERAVLLSDRLWRRRYNADAAIVGRMIRVNDRELLVVGVMPPGFRFPETDELWLPLGTADATNHQARYLFAVGRLAQDAPLAQARASAATVSREQAARYPETHRDWTIDVRRFRDAFVDAPAQRLLVVMLGAVAFVLLIACANVANLLLARATERTREVTVRAALGASRARVVRLFLTESIMLALIAAALGILVAAWWVSAMVHRIPEEMAYWIDFTIDLPVLIYTLVIALGTGILFGTLPALQAARTDLHSGMKEAGRTIGEGRSRARLRGVLVAAEVALSVVLLIGAVLMMQSFLRLQRADIGFDDSRIYSARIVTSGDRYDDPQNRIVFYHDAAQRIGELRGVAAAAATLAIPADDGGPTIAVRSDDGETALTVTALASTTQFFDVLGTPLIAGRAFTETESRDTLARVAIVGRTLAQRLWPDGDAIGRRVRIGTQQQAPPYTIVGVAPDLQYEELGEAGETSRLQLHLPYGNRVYRQMALLVRATANPQLLAQPVREALRTVDASLAPFDELTMRDRRRYTTWPQRVFGQTFGGFGGVALLLAVIGVYGVMSYTVAQRRREIGVRLALGARPFDVLRAVVARAVIIAGAGVIVGTAAAFGLVRILEGLLYGVSMTDPVAFVAVPALLLGAAALAAYVPARRAARVDPLQALRAD
jgi:putative ABC transport system permease protein